MTSRVGRAVAAIAAGRPVVVADDERRENEGDLIVAAELVSTATMAFLVRHTSGYVCVGLPEQDCERLALPAQCRVNQDPHGTAFRVPVDAVGTGTGISARDRALTARTLADPWTSPADLQRPGHLVPLAARPGGVLERRGHTEAAVDLARMARLAPAGVLCEIVGVDDPTRMARGRELRVFAEKHDLAFVTVAELAEYRARTEMSVERVTEARLPVDRVDLRAVGYRAWDGTEQIALVAGNTVAADVTVHVHRECVLGDVFGAVACGCRAELDRSLDEVRAAGEGVVVYVRSAPTGAAERLVAGCAGGPDPRARSIAGLILHDLRSTVDGAVDEAIGGPRLPTGPRCAATPGAAR